MLQDFFVYGLIFILSWYMYKLLIKPFLSPLRQVCNRNILFFFLEHFLFVVHLNVNVNSIQLL